MTDCTLEQLDNGKWWCPECDPDKQRLLPVKAHRNCRVKLTVTDRTRKTLKQLESENKMTRPWPEVERILSICTQQCDRFGSRHPETCSRFGRPCYGAIQRWTRAIADKGCTCERWAV